MCPPSRPPPPTEIGLYWSDQQIITFVNEYTPGSCLPNNVLADASPYQYRPSNLPEGFWHLVNTNEKKESVYGFWKAKGEACKIYSDSTISGWRTTLEYFEGQAPHGQRTNWLMQEYTVRTELSDKNKPKELSRLLCRVFLCDGHCSKSEKSPQNCKNAIEPKKVDSVASINPNTGITSGQDSRSESKAKRECEEGQLPVAANDRSIFSPEPFSEQECIARGDYLELNDLYPESHSSSSQNSSCPSKLSDEYFDSTAFLRDIEEEANKHLQEPPSSSRHNFIASARPNDIVLQPPSSGLLLSNVVEGPRPSSTVRESSRPSTSHGNAESKEEKKTNSPRKKKLKFLFCFTSF
ncbi:hypothetical protein CDL12_14914 [Handroanthus impetiginosus]|uniref:NAC domain-containing protein n=1 Tax=Handroanthus impetiginosus TaxID=429701 RepID=A0A2G9H4L9_9LAMI|nr:hypothetical protein CDL12_14914 [Handroanthus impetiginosus]